MDFRHLLREVFQNSIRFLLLISKLPKLATNISNLFYLGQSGKDDRNFSFLNLNGSYFFESYISGQKFLNDQSIWHNFFVSQPIDLKFWSNLHITIVYFFTLNGPRDCCFWSWWPFFVADQ
jgi:hypothetical protein